MLTSTSQEEDLVSAWRTARTSKGCWHVCHCLSPHLASMTLQGKRPLLRFHLQKSHPTCSFGSILTRNLSRKGIPGKLIQYRLQTSGLTKPFCFNWVNSALYNWPDRQKLWTILQWVLPIFLSTQGLLFRQFLTFGICTKSSLNLTFSASLAVRM